MPSEYCPTNYSDTTLAADEATSETVKTHSSETRVNASAVSLTGKNSDLSSFFSLVRLIVCY
jgi:hypothetical protein